MKKLLPLLLCLALALCCAACGSSPAAEASAAQDEAPGAAELANPFVDCASLAEAASVAGFDMFAPLSLDGYPVHQVQAVEGQMIQVVLASGELGADGTQRILLRKALGSEDISGDYNDYKEVQTVANGEDEVTVKGNDGLCYVAVWQSGDYSFSVSVDGGCELTAMTELIASLH